MPVLPNKKYTVTLHVNIPKEALSPDAGLYHNGKLLAPFSKSGEQIVKAEVNSGAAEKLVFDLKCKGWSPKEHKPDSQDSRTLGIMLFAADVRAADAPQKVYNANSVE